MSLPRPDLGDRSTQLTLGAAVLVVVALSFAAAVAGANYRQLGMLAGLVATPALIALALRAPYVFPYGLYAIMVPFDNLLKIGGAGTLTKMLGAASALCLLVYAIRKHRIVRPPIAMWCWFVFLVLEALGTMWSPDSNQAMLELITFANLIVMFAVLAVAPIGERELRAVCTCIVIGGVLSSLYGMYLLHQMPAVNAGDYGRLMINVNNRDIDPNHFANALLAPIAIALVALLHARRPLPILLSLAALGVLMSGLVMSLSREALVAAVAIVVVAVAFSRRRLLGATVGGVLLAGIPLAVPTIGARMAEGFSTGGAGRTSIWHVALKAFEQHPVIGWGTGAAVYAYQKLYLTVFQTYAVGWDLPPHNTPLHIAVDLGGLGLVAFCAALFATLMGMRGIKRTSSLYDLRVALTGAFVAIVVVSMFIDLETYKYFWLILAACAQLRTAARLAPAAAPAVYLEMPETSYVPARRLPARA